VATGLKDSKTAVERTAGEGRTGPRWIGWTSFLFAVLQSICTFFAAANGLRFAIGLGALAVSSGVIAARDWFHSDAVRLPMEGLSLMGALLNLVVLWQVRRLRAKPAAQWRMTAPSARKLRMERVQFWLSIITLVLLGVEGLLHIHFHGHV
jgi:hypothetical protein